MPVAQRHGSNRRNDDGNTQRMPNGRWQAYTADTDTRSQPRSNASATPRHEGVDQIYLSDYRSNDRSSARPATQNVARQPAHQSRQYHTNTTAVPATTQRQTRRPSVSQPSAYASSSTSTNYLNSQVSNAPPLQFQDASDANTGVSNRLYTGPPLALVAKTDPEILKDLKRPVHRAISSRNHPAQRINLSYKFKSDRQHDWFRKGRVFEIWYAEPANASTMGTSGAGSVSDPAVVQGNGGSYIYSKLRRFVVYRNGRMSCTALGIFSYGGQACGPPSREPKDHGIVHIARQPPLPFASELDENGRSRLGYPPIRINADDPKETLKASSRINYGKLYNIEHNLPVRNIGNVIELQQFLNNVDLEYGFGRQNAYASHNNRTHAVPSSSVPRSRAEAQQTPVSMTYSIPSSDRYATVAHYSTNVNALSQGMSAARISSPSTTASATADDHVVRELARRLQTRRPEASWDRCVRQAIALINRATAGLEEGSDNDDDDEEEHEDD